MAEFEKGLQAREVCEKFPEISRTTINEWFKPFRQNSVRIPSERQTKSTGQLQVVSPPATVVTLVPHQEESDFELARKILRGIVKDDDQLRAVRVQACNALLKTVEIRHNLHKSIFAEIEEVSVDELRKGYEEMDALELQREFDKRLKQG